jgi:hypothetical protein
MAQKGFLIGPQLVAKIKETIARVDGMPYGGGVSQIPTRAETSPTYVPKVFRVCTAAGAWPIDTSKSVTFLGVTATPNTVSVINKIVSLPAPASTNTSRIVNVAKDGTAWYLVSFQMSTATAVFSGRTQTITFVGTHATQTVAFATPGESVSVLTNISAVLNSSNCSITVNKTTTSVRVVGSTQTATIMSMSGTQTAVITTGTYTATYITLEI